MHVSGASRIVAIGWSVSAVLLLAAAGGCEIPESVHPLSDAASSQIDGRLLGVWHLDSDRNADRETRSFAIGRHPQQPNVHEWGYIELDAQKHVTLTRVPFFVTAIGDDWFISVLLNENDPPEKQRYLLLRYEFVGNDEVRVYGLNKERVVQAIESGQLEGEVRYPQPADRASGVEKRRPASFEIQAATPTLVEYVRQHGRDLFAQETPLRFRRLP